MGNGQYIRSVGRCYIKCKLVGSGEHEEGRCFHVLRKCVAPLVVGLGFIQKTQLLTKKRHLLVDSPIGFMRSIPMLAYTGGQATVDLVADEHRLVGCADTGSDFNLMSLECAVQRRFKIDDRLSSQSRVMLPDESEATTMGIVNVKSLQMRGIDGLMETSIDFHILPDLPFDVILGEKFLEETDAFNKYNIIKTDSDRDFLDFNIFINLGPIQNAMAKLFMPRSDTTVDGDKEGSKEQAEHDSLVEVEHYRRNKTKREISRIKDPVQASSAQLSESKRVRRFDEAHRSCRFCTLPP